MIGDEETKLFQKGEVFLNGKTGLRIHLAIGKELKYLSKIILCQILSQVVALQKEFASKAVLNRGRFMKPQPP
jgi:hypothetical protein